VQTQLPVIRTYTGADREATQEAYRRDARQARAAGWVPVAHRWRMDGDAHELAVVFELHPLPAAGEDAISTPVPDAGAEEAQPSAENEAVVDDASAPPEVSPAVPRPDPDAGPAATVGSRAAVTAAVAPVSVARARSRATIETIDLHAGGEPIRLIRSGYPRVPVAPILERRRWVREHADSARQVLMFEPRGHRDMYGAVLLPPHREDADIAVLFMHNEGYSTMCGHGIIALTTGLIEEGLYPASVPRTTIRWETPAGLVTATASTETAEDGHVEVRQVSFVNVPAYLHARDLVVRPPGVGLAGPVTVQLAFGGAYYGIVDAAELGLRVVPASVVELTRIGAAITEALRADHTPIHPLEPDLGFVYGTIIVDMDPATSPDGLATDATMRNVTVFADAEVDRSPCGSGTSALLAWLHGAGRVAIGDEIANASITGAVFQGRVEGATRLGDRFAVSTSVTGTGYVTGYHTFVVDERDPLGDGFLLH
jgi:proline racemase